MAFESLSESYELTISDFPSEWLPLTYLYDPDLPLFPIQYFHMLDPNLPLGHRPGERDRLFGFIHHINLEETSLKVSVIVNKNLTLRQNQHYQGPLENVVSCRLGLENPVTLADIKSSLISKLSGTNKIFEELWYSVIDGSFGKKLPFGRIWDPVFGLVRFVASWNSPGGRKGELIQTHSFASEFGVKIQPGGNIHVDFYLLPTYEELTSSTNPLSIFPRFMELSDAADDFTNAYCERRSVGEHIYSGFVLAKAEAGRRLDNIAISKIINNAHPGSRRALSDNHSAFDRGPQRSIIFLMMLHDLRNQNWSPESFTPSECGEMYSALDRSYQTPKVIQLYAQQCFGSEVVLPIDNWVETFLKWPFEFRASKKSKYHEELFSCSNVWGKLERIIWIAAQARKVHSSVCAEILWCVRFGSPKEGKRPGKLRGANPLSCKICETHIRKACPSYAAISGETVSFNDDVYTLTGTAFNIITTSKENTTKGQHIESCEGEDIKDIYSTRDRTDRFGMFPAPAHDGSNITVDEFISIY